MSKLTIYTDGASRGNPGHSSYGFVISDSDGNLLKEGKKYLGVNTNNFAEYSAVLAALEYLAKNHSGEELDFYMDSRLVVEQLSGRFKIKAPNLLPLVGEIRQLEREFSKVNYTHVYREKNKVADKLANDALDQR